MNTQLTWIGLVCIIATVVTGVQGAVVSVQSGTLSPGAAGTLDIILDSAPSGISGYQMTVQSDNAAVAKVTGATYPSWAALSEALPGDGGSFALRAIDLNSGVEAGASQVTLATLSVQATGSGTAQITIQNLQIDDDAGNALQAEAKSGTVTVSGGSTPVVPSTKEISVSLQTGWNLISIPMQPAAGFETAAVFQNVQSAGHSILTYDGSGWITIGKDHQLKPMTGYWIYTTSPVTIPLTVKGSPAEGKALNAGWNLAGISGTSPASAEKALSGLSSWSYIVSYDAARQQYRDAGMKESQSQITLNPGEGFWIYLDTPGTLSPGA